MKGFLNFIQDKKFTLLVLTGWIVLSILIWGCGGGGSGGGSVESAYSYQVPQQTDDGWTTADLRETSANIKLLEQMIPYLGNSKIHSVLIVLDGKLVFEEYFPGFDFVWGNFDSVPVNYNRDTLHHLASATKSFSSALIGIAIDQGRMSGVDERLFDFFPDYSSLNDVSKSGIKLEDVLTMRAGLRWDESSYPYTSTQNDAVAIAMSSDWYDFVLDKDAVSPPGQVFNYNSGLSILLGGIIANAGGATADTFAAANLFTPLNITAYQWDKGPQGEIQTGGGLWLRPRDMAKFGQLFLNKGLWNGNRVVSEEWVNQSSAKHVPFSSSGDYPQRTGYGYQWWWSAFKVNGNVYEAYHALGWGGQIIFVFDQLKMVVVFTGGDYLNQNWQGLYYTNKFVLPAMLSAIP